VEWGCGVLLGGLVFFRGGCLIVCRVGVLGGRGGGTMVCAWIVGARV